MRAGGDLQGRLFTPQFTIKPSASVTLGQTVEAQYPELIPVSFSFDLIVGALVIPMTVDFGVQVGVKASGGFQLTTSGAVNFAPGQIGIKNGSPIITVNPSFQSDPQNHINVVPLAAGVDVTVKVEPFVALSVGKTIGFNTEIELARFRILAGFQGDIGGQLLLFSNNSCGTYSISPIAEADFAPADIEILSAKIFDNTFTFFQHEWDPILPVQQTAGCVYKPSAQIDVQWPIASNNADTVLFGQAGVVLSGLASVARGNDPITSYGWSINGIDILSGIQLDATNQSTVRVTPSSSGLQPGQVAEVDLTITTLSGTQADKVIKLIGNAPPIPIGTIDIVGNTATLNASFSSDSDGQIVLWRWDLPEGRVVRQRAVAPISVDVSDLQRPVIAKLTVFDNAGDSASLQVTASEVPQPVISSVLVNPTSPKVGDLVTFSVNGTNLHSGYTFTLPGCTPTEISSASSVRRQFACSLTVAGSDLQGTIGTTTGTVLFSFLVTATVPPSPVPPTVVLAPQSLTVLVGHAATFTVSAAGTIPLSYQWRRNGVSIPGATGDTYFIASANSGDNSASFDVLIQNSAGSVVILPLFFRTRPIRNVAPVVQAELGEAAQPVAA